MKDERYLPPCCGRWALSRQINGEWVGLVQDSYMDDESLIPEILRAIGIYQPSNKDVSEYFPLRNGCRRPTLELLEKFARISTVRSEVGV